MRAISSAPRRWCWISSESGRKFRYLFSGDVGRGNDDILRDPEPVENVDYLQVESTYGGREHAPKATPTRQVGAAGAAKRWSETGKSSSRLSPSAARSRLSTRCTN